MVDKNFFEQNIKNVLKQTDFKNLGDIKRGKVRDIYLQADKIILVATDRYSAFDRILAHVPFKGHNLTQITKFWFENTSDIVQNHIIDNPDPNVLIVRKCEVLPIEVVIRGYITGVTSTSLWTNYNEGQRDFVLPDGLKKNQKLNAPIITPTTKSDVHDTNISIEQILEQRIVDPEVWEQVKEISLKLFERGQEIASQKGLILVDTKYEFGLDEEGRLTLIDEIHTPDSSRYWLKASYEQKIAAGQEPEYFDKEFLRLWFKENSDPYKDLVLPEAPDDLIAEMARRYVFIYESLTGLPFKPDEQPIISRIESNLKKYSL